MTTYCFIINYNRLHYPRRMADYLAEVEGVTPVIVDNCSDYPPLLEYYEETPHIVHRMEHNMGNISWLKPTLDEFDLHENFIVTDPDLIIDHIPKDWLPLLYDGLARHSFACKAGFSLEIDDLPDTQIAREARGREGMEWQYCKGDKRFYHASIDTTFALWRTRLHDFPGLRAARPYTAKHAPWYFTPGNIPEDELYYLQTTDRNWNWWTTKIREELGLTGRKTDWWSKG